MNVVYSKEDSALGKLKNKERVMVGFSELWSINVEITSVVFYVCFSAGE